MTWIGPFLPDWLGVVDHVEAAGARWGVANYVGHQGRVHLQQVVASQQELVVLETVLEIRANIIFWLD